MDFIKRNIAFISVVVGTLLLLIGGVFLFTKSGNTQRKSVNRDLLIGKNSYQSDASASATLVEFGDYQCPACGLYHPLIKQLLIDFKGKINFIFRNFPLSQHANAKISSYAVEAAGLQGKYWEMHNKVYETQNDWSASTDAKSIFVKYAEDLGLNPEKFLADIDSSLVKDKVTNDYNDGVAVGIDATPTFYLNGNKMDLFSNYEELKNVVEPSL